LPHLEAMTLHKRALAEAYFAGLPQSLTLPRRRDDEYDVFHIFGIRHPKRDALRQYLLEQGVKTEVHYPIPPHRQEAMQGIISGEYPVADELHNTELSLPISVGHSVSDIQQVIEIIRQFK
jgi:dTDP-4-amino-4,6-dideoxygalactose transaminase